MKLEPTMTTEEIWYRLCAELLVGADRAEITLRRFAEGTDPLVFVFPASDLADLVADGLAWRRERRR